VQCVCTSPKWNSNIISQVQVDVDSNEHNTDDDGTKQHANVVQGIDVVVINEGLETSYY